MSCRLPNPKLNVGHYHLRAHLSEPPGGQHYETLDGICSFEIVRFDRGSPWGWRPQACAYHEEYAWKKVSAVTELVSVSPLLSNEEYIRERLDPKPGDPYYLHLSDLLLAIREEIPAGAGRVLDYGCGGSPYRSLFTPGIYHRADLAGVSSLDFEFGEDSRVAAASSDYDCVLSSQVLEHVASPKAYLKECYRVLKPGGRLSLLTDGLFRRP